MNYFSVCHAIEVPCYIKCFYFAGIKKNERKNSTFLTTTIKKKSKYVNTFFKFVRYHRPISYKSVEFLTAPWEFCTKDPVGKKWFCTNITYSLIHSLLTHELAVSCISISLLMNVIPGCRFSKLTNFLMSQIYSKNQTDSLN